MQPYETRGIRAIVSSDNMRNQLYCSPHKNRTRLNSDFSQDESNQSHIEEPSTPVLK